MLELTDGGDGHLLLRGVDDTIAHCLRQVPAILQRRDSAPVRERLHPDGIPADAARNHEWHRLVDAELRHLFEAAADTFARDLGRLDPARGEIRFPAEHLKAWMSSVNQARLVLSELHGLTETDFQRTEIDMDSRRDGALAVVQLLAYVLQTLVEHALEQP